MTPTQKLNASEQDFREAIRRALDALLTVAGPLPVATDLFGMLARYALFAEVATLANAAKENREAWDTYYLDALAKTAREHAALMRDNDTPEYLREGAEPPTTPEEGTR